MEKDAGGTRGFGAGEYIGTKKLDPFFDFNPVESFCGAAKSFDNRIYGFIMRRGYIVY